MISFDNNKDFCFSLSRQNGPQEVLETKLLTNN